MARDRNKRARQRRQRPADAANRQVREGAQAQAQGATVRADLPGALSHTGDVDEFDAALIRGAGGEPAQEASTADGEPSSQAEQPATAPAALRSDRRRGAASAELAGVSTELPTRAPRQSVGRRAVAFLRASWAELQRVQWPDRRQVTQATTVVLGFVAVAGLYLGAADWVAQKIVNFIL